MTEVERKKDFEAAEAGVAVLETVLAELDEVEAELNLEMLDNV